MVICIIGGSGSGKDTQGKILAENLNLPHVSMGQIIRDEEQKNNPVAIEAHKTAVQGQWVSGELIADLLKNYLSKNCQDGCVLNGFPRSIDQLSYFPPILNEIGEKLVCVVHIKVPDEVLIQRMQKQRDMMEQSGQSRADVSDEAIAQRLKSYHESIDPILHNYAYQKILVEVDGTPDIDTVSKEMQTKVAEFLPK